jgi:hypothetical protein
VSPPNLKVLLFTRNPRHPYTGTTEAIKTRMTRTCRFDQPKRFCKIGHKREPRIPEVGVKMPMIINEDGDM